MHSANDVAMPKMNKPKRIRVLKWRMVFLTQVKQQTITKHII